MDRISQLKEYLKASPKDSFLQHALALEYIKSGNDEEAKLLFEELLRNEPGYVGSYYHLGKLLQRTNDLDGAIIIYKKGMEMASAAGDRHSLGELSRALEDAEDEMDG